MGKDRSWVRWVLLIAVAQLLAVAASAAPKAVAAAQKLAGEGKDAYLARDYERAAALFASAIRNFAHEDLHFMHGRSLEQLAQFRAAADAFVRAATLAPAGPARDVMALRATTNAQLDQAQQLMIDGQSAKALPVVRAAHAVLFAQARRASDGQVYPEPAAALVLLARAELTAGGAAAAQQLLADVIADPTAPPAVVERARAMAAAAPSVRVDAAEAPKVIAPPATSPEATAPADHSAPLAKAESAPEATPVVVGHAAAPAPEMRVGVWAALGTSAAVAVAGGAWWAMSAGEASNVQAKLTAAAAGGKVDGLTQVDYAAAKVRLDRGVHVGSLLTLVGGAGLAASALWWWLGADTPAPARPAVVLLDGGAMVTVGAQW